MLRFMETHDEIRLASKYFLSDPLKAIPGMLVTACLNKGPLLIYNGQEVGEPAEGAKGFSGDDGRTSIFDYTCMPALQKWVNSGKFDGRLLSEEQKTLRNFYKGLLSLAQKTAVAHGHFYDLMWVNQHYPAPDPSRIFAWLRHCNGEILLFISNFDSEHIQRFRLFIPLHAFGVLNLDVNDDFLLTPVFCFPDIDQTSFTFKGYLAAYDGIEFSVPASSASVFLISKYEI